MFGKVATAVAFAASSSILSVAAAGNQALSVNRTVADADITTRGSDFLWAVFAIMFASALGVTVWGLMTPPGKRAFHFIGVAILFTASIAYFSMASDLGATPVYVEFVRHSAHLISDPNVTAYTRSIWYARYIDWFVTTPLLLSELLLSTGMPLSGIFMTIFFDIVMIVGGLIGALVPSSYKWGYFTGACIAMFYVFWALIMPARANARALGGPAYKAYWTSALVLSFLWLLYPIAWGLADGGNVISPDSEMVFYGILDVLAKPCFLIFHLFGMRGVPYEVYQLQSGHYSAYANVGSGLVPHTGDHGIAGHASVQKAATKVAHAGPNAGRPSDATVAV